MLESLARNWWLTALRGFLALILGIFMFVFPVVSIAALVIFFGAYALVDGIFAVVASLMSAAEHRPRWWLLIEGSISVLIGMAVFVWPAITAMVLLYFIAVWAFITGIMEIIFVAELWKTIPHNWLWLINGILSLILGILMVAFPGFGLVLAVLFIAAYLVLFGIALIALGFTLKGKGAAKAEQLKAG